MSQPRVIVVSDEGDPSSPKTWSGTPSNLIGALREVGCEVSGLDLTVKRSIRGALAAVSLGTGNGREFRRTEIYRKYSRFTRQSTTETDVVFLHTASTTILPAQPKRHGCRHAIYLDSTFHLMSQHTLTSYRSATRRKYDRFEAEALQAADFLFTASECAAEDLVNHYGIPKCKVAAVGTGLGKIKAFTGEKDYSAKTILFVAKQRFVEKGGRLLLDAFRLCHATDPRMQLTVIATEENRKTIEAVPGVIYKSNISWNELESLFNHSTLYAMPALHEPWGLVYLEALVCRTPILGLKRNAFPEMSNAGRCGFVVEEATPEAVAKTLLEALSDVERLATMGSAGQNYVQERYSWIKTASRIYEKLFSGTDRPQSSVKAG